MKPYVPRWPVLSYCCTLLQIRIEDVALPLAFGEQQALDLVSWKGNEADPRFLDVLAAVNLCWPAPSAFPPAPHAGTSHRSLARVRRFARGRHPHCPRRGPLL